jgi:putative transposase
VWQEGRGMRKYPLRQGETYHIFNKSIAGFKIFNHPNDAGRMVELIRYYKVDKPAIKFSHYFRGKNKDKKPDLAKNKDDVFLVDIVAYCVMPTHLHLVLKELLPRGISLFMNNILNAYSRYFNIKYNRKGPLWEGRFQNVLCENDEQLLHLTRYVHLNPVTAEIVAKPEHWEASSYLEYVPDQKILKDEERICEFKEILDIDPKTYKKFVEDRISYQRTLAAIKDLIVE